MESRVNYTAVGVFVVMLTVMLIAFGYWLTSGRHNKTYNTYTMYMNEAVYGLIEQAPVKYNGVTVGFVQDVDLVPDNLQQVKLTLKIENDVPITEATEGTLKAQGITGVTYIGLEATSTEAPPLRVEGNEKYPIIKSTRSVLVQLNDALADLSKNLATISKNFTRIFDDENTKAFKDSLRNIQSVTGVLAKNGNNISDSLSSANKFLSNAAKSSDQIPVITTKLNKTLDSIQSMTSNFTETSNEVRQTMQHGKRALDDLSTQAIPEAVQVLNRLKYLTGNLEELSTDLKENPSILIRGRQPPAPGPGE